VISPFRVYLFDVDGTLLDSAPDICGAILEVLSRFPTNNVSEAFLRRYIGRNLQMTFRELIPHISQEQIEELIQAYRTIYPARDHRMTRVYPGVEEALARLGGKKTTATTKSTATTRAVLEKFGLLRYFDHIQGTDGFPSKPEPDVILLALAALEACPEECLLVGDSSVDMEAGRRAGVRICAVRYGYGDPDELTRWQPDYWISDLRELVS
jgi:HAD superfamily hydrolase (TIGR01509 family)